MVVLTTSETATARVLAVLANATVTGGDVAAVLSCVGEPRRHLGGANKQESEFSCVGCIRGAGHRSSADLARFSLFERQTTAWGASSAMRRGGWTAIRRTLRSGGRVLDLACNRDVR